MTLGFDGLNLCVHVVELQATKVTYVSSLYTVKFSLVPSHSHARTRLCMHLVRQIYIQAPMRMSGQHAKVCISAACQTSQLLPLGNRRCFSVVFINFIETDQNFEVNGSFLILYHVKF